MKIFFLTQSFGLDLFYRLMRALGEIETVDRAGFYVTDARFYDRFLASHRNFEADCPVMKEWKIIEEAATTVPDLALLSGYEEKLGKPCLWDALVADRRIFFGKKYAYAQDYRSRFSHDQMLAILQTALIRMEAFFNQLKPDVIVSFQCVTLGDYLSWLFAEAMGIPVLNLRPTRIRNYFYADENIHEPSPRLGDLYKKYREGGIPGPGIEKQASDYITEVRRAHAMYEGVVPPSDRPPPRVNSGERHPNPVFHFLNILRDEFHYRFGRYRFDNHAHSILARIFHQRMIRPIKTRLIQKQFRHVYLREKDLPGIPYAFFPLHTEPEVTLSVYSKPYMNQIEAVRLVSRNLPVGMKLVVKEHPWSVGKRPASYYKKLLDIPNVVLACPSLTSRILIQHAKLVTIIASSIGLEAAMLKKPVMILGRTPFNFLPSTMLRSLTNPEILGFHIRELLLRHAHDENALQSYVAAVLSSSVPVDFYTRLLGRKGAYNPKGDGRRFDSHSVVSDKSARSDEEARQVGSLARYLLDRFEKVSRTVGNKSPSLSPTRSRDDFLDCSVVGRIISAESDPI